MRRLWSGRYSKRVVDSNSKSAAANRSPGLGGGVRAEPTLSLDSSGYAGKDWNIDERWKGYESYNITGELKNSGEPLTVKGRSDWDQLFRWENDSASGRFVDTIEAFELRVGTHYIALTNTETRLEGTESNLEYSMAGTLIGSAIQGHVQVSTPTPVSLSVNEACPTEGIIRVASDGSAEVRYGSSAAGTAGAVAVWIDGQIVESHADCNTVGFVPIL